MPNESIYSFAALHNRLRVKGNLVALTALRIGAGRSNDVVGNDLPVLRDSMRRPFLPGASLKGAFRARTESLIRAIAPDQAHDIADIEVWQTQVIAPLKQREEYRNNDRGLSEAIWNHSTMIDLTFGAPWMSGRIFFKDALVDPTLWFGQFEVRNGVVLNRDTETAENSLLYDYEVVPAGTRFQFELVLENATDWQLGMILLALKPWERGEVQIGGFRSRGLGYVHLEDTHYHYVHITGVDDILTMLNPDETAEQTTLDETRIQEWITAFRDTLQSHAAQNEYRTN